MTTKCLIGIACILFWDSVVSGSEKSAMQVVYNENYFPFSYVKESKLQGLEVDLMNELAKKMDLEISHKGYPWDRAQAMVVEGKADAFVTVLTTRRLEYSVMSRKTFFNANIVAATSRDNPRLQALLKITDLKDASQFTHVNSAGSGWIKSFLAKSRVTYIGSIDSIFKFLLANRADLYVETEYSIRLNRRRLKLDDKVIILPAVLSTIEFRLGISRRSPLATQMKSFDDAIDRMHHDGIISKVYAKWLNKEGRD